MTQDTPTTETDAPTAEISDEFAHDVDATIEQLAHLLDVDDSQAIQIGPFGAMTEADMINLVRPKLCQWVGANDDLARMAVALIHKSTGDLLEKHADRPADELAREALQLQEHE